MEISSKCIEEIVTTHQIIRYFAITKLCKDESSSFSVTFSLKSVYQCCRCHCKCFKWTCPDILCTHYELVVIARNWYIYYLERLDEIILTDQL